MKEFEPSSDFVTRVMAGVRTETRTVTVSIAESVFVKSTQLRWSLVVGGAVMTLLNLSRMLASVIAPALCG